MRIILFMSVEMNKRTELWKKVKPSQKLRASLCSSSILEIKLIALLPPFVRHTSKKKMTASNTCCLCQSAYEGYGNNPAPLINTVGARCCDACNNVVVFVRVMSHASGQRLNRTNWITMIRNQHPDIQRLRLAGPFSNQTSHQAHTQH